MSQHITRQEMEAFCAQELPGRETITVARHFHDCPVCQRLFADAFKSQHYHTPLSFNFSPEFVRDDHLEDDDVADYAEGKIDQTESELLEAHCRVCPRCRGDVRDFQEYLREFAQYRNVWLGPAPLDQRVNAWWRKILSTQWLPHPAPVLAGVCIMLMGIAVLTVVFLRLQPSRVEVQPPPLQPSSPSSHAQGTAPPAIAEKVNTSSGPKQRDQVATPLSSENLSADKGGRLLIAVNDGGRRYGINADGQVVGIAGYPLELKEEIKRVMRGEIVQSVPPVEVASTPVKSRGVDNGQQVKLIGPLSTYIVSDRPVLIWQSKAVDVHYVVSVVDEDFNEVVNSPQLSTTNWQVSQKLARGRAYQWQVLAFKEIQEVTPTQREVGKFMVISEEKFREIEKAKKKYPSHLALGLLYKKENMLNEAEKEFRQLLIFNPKSGVVRKLLRSVQIR